VERGVRQGCPLAPYLFILIKEVTSRGVIKGISEGYKATNSISICKRHYIFNERRGKESTNYSLATKKFPFYKWIGYISTRTNPWPTRVTS
jgi:hypothetical protein